MALSPYLQRNPYETDPPEYGLPPPKPIGDGGPIAGAGGAGGAGGAVSPAGAAPNAQLARLMRLQDFRSRHAAFNAQTPQWHTGGLGTSIPYDPSIYGSDYTGPSISANNPARMPWVGPGADPRAPSAQPPTAPGPTALGAGNLSSTTGPVAPPPGQPAYAPGPNHPNFGKAAPIQPPGQPFYAKPGTDPKTDTRDGAAGSDRSNFAKFATFRQQNGLKPMRYGVGGI